MSELIIITILSIVLFVIYKLMAYVMTKFSQWKDEKDYQRVAQKYLQIFNKYNQLKSEDLDNILDHKEDSYKQEN